MIHSKLLNKNLDKNQLKYVNHQHKSSLKHIKIIHYIFVTKKKHILDIVHAIKLT